MYRELKEKHKDLIRYQSEADTLLQTLAEMFEYTCDDFLMEYAELYLNVFGSCAFWMLDGELIVSMCQRAGKPDVHGLGSDLICTTMNGIVKTFNDFMQCDDVVYVKNNKYATSESSVEIIADLMGEIDKSIKYNIRNSRLRPIVKVTDKKTQKALELALTQSKEEDDFITLMSANLLEGDNGLDVYHVTDVKDQDKIQYLNRAYEDLRRRFLSLFGLDTCGSVKMAQESVAELNSGCNSRLIIPLQKLEERQKGMAAINAKFGKSWSVAFSLPWILELQQKNGTDEEGNVIEEEGGASDEPDNNSESVDE